MMSSKIKRHDQKQKIDVLEKLEFYDKDREKFYDREEFFLFKKKQREFLRIRNIYILRGI